MELTPMTVKKGDAVYREIDVYAPNNAPLDLSSAVVLFRIWIEGTTTDVIGPVTLDVNVENPANPFIILDLSPGDLTPLNLIARYWYDVKIQAGITLLEGRFYVEDERIR